MSLFAALSVATAAAAQESVERAQQLAAEAGQLFKDGQFADAAQRFSDAHDAYPDLSLKMNEMVAWYKAERCDRALSAAKRAREYGLDTFGAQDVKDLGKVEGECNRAILADAQKQFDAGDLEGAERTLSRIRTDDPDMNREVGKLQAKIDIQRDSGTQTDPDPDPNPQTPTPPPEWAKTGGFISLGVGGLGTVVLVIKYLLDRKKVTDGFNTIGADYSCTYSNGEYVGAECDRSGVGQDTRFEPFAKQVRTANTVNTIAGVASGVFVVAGAGMLAYYYMSGGGEASGEATWLLVPTMGPDYAGATLDIRF